MSRCCARTAIACAAVCTLSVLGCFSRSAERPAPGPPDSEVPAPPPPAAAGQVTLRTFDENQFAETLKKYRGKVILADFWATWCAPCKEDFPHTVRLHRELADRGLAVVSVSLDPLENEPQVLKFLTAEGATCDNFIARHGGSGEAFEVLQIPDGTLPHLKLFDRGGKLRKTFPQPSSPIKPAEIDRAVKELLAEPAGPE
jgi:thiol-disulfide isomerase/thioredoxin